MRHGLQKAVSDAAAAKRRLQISSHHHGEMTNTFLSVLRNGRPVLSSRNDQFAKSASYNL